jgi:phage terminase large subunit-like protein
VLDGTTPNDSWFAYVATLDEGDDWTDERVWPKANPLLGVTVTLRYLREQVQEALDMPAKQALVRRLNFCVWTEASVGAIEMDRWDLGAGTPNIPRGAEVTAGLDLASTTDLTAFLMLHDAPDGKVDVLARFWAPEEGIAIRSRRDHVPYDVWAREGWITTTPGNVTDYDRVREDIHELSQVYRIREIGYDPWNATQIVTQLMADGARCVPIRQGMASMAAPTREWLADIAADRLRHGGNPVLRWMASNLVVEQDAAGNLKPAKDKSTERIDGQVAAIMAKARMLLPAAPVVDRRIRGYM